MITLLSYLMNTLAFSKGIETENNLLIKKYVEHIRANDGLLFVIV
jgi:hypothetical protein